MRKYALVSVVGLILVSSMLPLVLPSPYVSTREHWINLPWLSIYVEAPEDSRENESYEVTVIISPSGEIYINSIEIRFINPSYKETILSNTETSSKITKTYNLKPEYVGNSWCQVDYDYVILKGTSFEKRYYGSFSVYSTAIREKTYNYLEDAYYNLKQDYENLNSSYHSLEKDYSNLCTKYNEQMNILFVFSITTIIFLLTTVYFFGRYKQLKKRWEKVIEEKKA
jgi:Mg2+ and Co2+ transporter CorA